MDKSKFYVCVVYVSLFKCWTIKIYVDIWLSTCLKRVSVYFVDDVIYLIE